MLLEPAFLSKAAGFPSAYRPKALEDRVKRAHVKQLDTQLEKMVRLGRDSPYSPVSEEIAVGLILEETPGKEKAGGIEEDDDEEKSNPDAGMQPILMKPIQTKRVKTAEEKAMDRCVVEILPMITPYSFMTHTVDVSIHLCTLSSVMSSYSCLLSIENDAIYKVGAASW